MAPRLSKNRLSCSPAEGIEVRIPDRGQKGEVVTTVEHVYKNGGDTIVVPAGYPTDLASVPRFLLWIFAPFSNHQRAALLHDYLYREQITDRFEADALFRVWMERLGVPCWRSWAMFYGVRCFGWNAWNHNAKLLAEREPTEEA